MQQNFDLDRWITEHRGDQPRDLERALRSVPADQRALALLTWLHTGNLSGRRIQVPLR